MGRSFTNFRICKGVSWWERSRKTLKGKGERNDVSSDSLKPAPWASGKTSHWTNKGVHEANAHECFHVLGKTRLDKPG